jgi:RNA polymerase sigma-70 factor (ECF subfamily)
MVAMRMDQRVRARFDPSDVIQEALVTAHARLPAYLDQRPLPFYPWLRRIAWEQLMRLQEQHLQVKKRSVACEADQLPRLNDQSAQELAHQLAGSVTAPSAKMMRDEMRRRVHNSLKSLRPRDREILELLYLEQLNSSDIAAILEISQSTVRTRHFRAIQRLSRLLEEQ